MREQRQGTTATKAAVRNGDPTTTRGFVIADSATILDANKRVALSGDFATCGNCKGSHPIYGTGKGISEKGRNVAVEGDLVMCPCKKNRVLRGINPGIFLHSDEGASGAMSAISAAGLSSSAQVFDERVRAIAHGALEGYPYYVQTADGRTYSGRLTADGKLPRIDTGASAAEYIVYWGDDALAKKDGA